MNTIEDAITEYTGDPGLFPAILESADYTETYDEGDFSWIAILSR